MNELLPPGAQLPAAPPPDGPLVKLARVLESAPRYLAEFLVGLLEACFTDTVTTALLIASIALSISVSLSAGVAAFFFVYVICRVVGNIAGAVGAVAGAANQSAGATGALAEQVGRFHKPPQT